MAEAKLPQDKPEAKAKAGAKKEKIPGKHELMLENYTSMGLVLVQFIGSKTVPKLAPSPSGAARELGSLNYGLVRPRQWLLVHKEDAKDKRFYRRPTAKERPKKDKIKLTISPTSILHVRVTWPGMPTDELDKINRN